MYILVTGAAGFIGQHLVKKLVQEEHNVIMIDLPGADWTFADGLVGVTPIEQDLADTDVAWWTTIMNDASPELSITRIYHLASIVGVSTVIDNPETMISDLTLNTTLTSYLRSEVRDIELIFTSSSEIYGEKDILEETRDLVVKAPDGYPRGIYASQKLAAEHLFLNCLNSNIDVRVLRLFSITGPGQSQEFVMPLMTQNALLSADITVNGDGSQSRMFMHVTDLVNFMTADLLFDSVTLEKLSSRIINVANVWNYTTMHKLAHLIKKILVSASTIVYDPEGEVGESSRSPQIRNMLEIYKPEISLNTIITDIAEIDFIPVKAVQASYIINDIIDPDSGLITNTTTITTSGTSEPNTSIEIFYTDETSQTLQADINGDWNSTYTAPEFPDGTIYIVGSLNSIEYSVDVVIVNAA